MVLRVIVFLSMVALGASFGTYVANPLYYNFLPYSHPRAWAVPLTAPAPEAPVAVEEPSPFSFAYTAEGEGGFSSRAESGEKAGDVSGSYSFNIPDGRERHVSYNAGTSGFTATVKSNEQGIVAGKNPADVQIFGLGLDEPAPSAPKAAAPAAPSLGSASPYSLMYSAVSGGGKHGRTEGGDTSGSVVGSYSLTHRGGSRRKVDYTAGDAGFKATVYTNEQGIIPGEDPADVSIHAFANDDKPTGAAGGAEPSGTSDGASGGAKTPFDFMYSAVSGGGLHGRTESGDASGKVVGSYSLTHKGGSRRKVDYTADGAGFKATVYTNEQGMIPGEDPADVSILAFAGDAVEPAGAAGGAVEPSGGSLTPFNFMYNAAEIGGASSRSETGDESGNVKGSYSVEDPDGRRRKVDYTAGTDGFKAKIHSNEPGVEPGSNPADVDISGYAGLPMISAGGPAAAPADASAADAPAAGAPAAAAPVGGLFDFMYTAPAGGGSSSRSESGEGGRKVTGSYSVEHPSGQKRLVDYSAGDLGFTATIKSNEQGVKPGDDPASVSILSLPGVPAAPAPADSPAPVAEPSPFSFMYTAEGGDGTSSRSESGTVGGEITGSYSLTIGDGRKRIVDYSAGTAGFKPNIQSNEQGVSPGDNPADTTIVGLPGGAPVGPVGGYVVSHVPAAVPAPVPVGAPVGPVSSYAVLHAPGAFAGPFPADIHAPLGDLAPGAISAKDLFEAAKYAPVSLSKVGGSPWYR